MSKWSGEGGKEKIHQSSILPSTPVPFPPIYLKNGLEGTEIQEVIEITLSSS